MNISNEKGTWDGGKPPLAITLRRSVKRHLGRRYSICLFTALTFLILISACTSGQRHGKDTVVGDTESETGDTDAGLHSDTHNNLDSDTEDIDSDDTDPFFNDQELVQSLSDVDDYLSEMVVYDGVIYFTFGGINALYRVDVGREQTFEWINETVRSLTVFGDLVWWFSLGDVARYTLKTGEIAYLSLGVFSDLSLDFTVDEDGMYFADHGCKDVVGMNHDGEIILHEKLVYDGTASFLPYVATGPEYVYCSGSSGAAYTAGKIYGVPKTGGEIVEIASTPITIENNTFHSTGPMKIVNDNLYYLHFYTGGWKTDTVWLLSAPAKGGESTILFKSEYGAYASPLVYDEEQRALYFTLTYSRLLYKYEINAGEIRTTPIVYYPQGQVTVDETYIYWYMNDGIYRMKKF